MSSEASFFNLSELAKRAQVGVETVRYYQRKGLLRKPISDSSDRKKYCDDDVARVRFIKRTQALEFTLKEIQRLLELRDGPMGSRSEVRKIVSAKIKEIEDMQDRLANSKEKLSELNGLCDGEDRIESCPILMALDGKDDNRH